MAVTSNELELAIGSVRIRKSETRGGWYASVNVVVTEHGGRKAHGCVHVHPRGNKLAIDDWDTVDAEDSTHFGLAIETQRTAIVEAVRVVVATETASREFGVRLP